MSNINDARELTSHRVNGLNEALRVFVLDKPGSGGACHDYAVLVPSERKSEDTRLDTSIQEVYHVLSPGFDPFVLMICGDRATIMSHEDKMDNDALGRQITTAPLFTVQRIRFQNGPVKEAGYNGNSHEALLAVLLDRMESFQKGPYAGRDNAMALTKLDEARLWLHKRTMDRASRGVEGTHQK